jgi:hypothetical protein
MFAKKSALILVFMATGSGVLEADIVQVSTTSFTMTGTVTATSTPNQWGISVDALSPSLITVTGQYDTVVTDFPGLPDSAVFFAPNVPDPFGTGNNLGSVWNTLTIMIGDSGIGDSLTEQNDFNYDVFFPPASLSFDEQGNVINFGYNTTDPQTGTTTAPFNFLSALGPTNTFSGSDAFVSILGTWDYSSFERTVVPIPAPLPLFGWAFGLLAALGWRRGRRVS